MKGFGMIGFIERGVLRSENKVMMGNKITNKGLKLGCVDVIKDVRLEEGLF